MAQLTLHSTTANQTVRHTKGPRLMQHATDVLILAVSFQIAYALRFDFEVPPNEWRQMLMQLPYVLLIQLIALRLSGVQTFIWRYIGMAEVAGFMNAAAWSALPLFILRLGLPEAAAGYRVPLSVIVIDTLIAFVALMGVRVMRRTLYERDKRLSTPGSRRRPKKAVLLIGAGRAGLATAREIQARGDLGLSIKGFVDDDESKHGLVIHGIRVLGSTADLKQLVPQLDIDHVLISMATASREQLKRIVDLCESISVKVRIIPALTEILEGNLNFSRIRDVQVEDLLGRAPVNLDDEEISRLFAERTVLVTGAGGSIGSELARQVGRFKPANILLVERAECALFTAERALRDTYPNLSIRPLVADIGDRRRMQSILSTYRPHVILHAAAHKHVSMMEENPTEAIKNNVLATYRLAQLSSECGVGVFVLISTDKAVRPTSVMGASKRMAELAVQTLNGRSDTRYVVVRFGNVIGSAGSVLPIFREQILKGGPLTVTHPDVTRYFMTIPEAAQLVLQAAAIGAGGEICILDMGEPLRILDLAKDTIRLSGLKPFEDIEITFTGLRPGEKLHEELETARERVSRTRHPQILVGDIAGLSFAEVQEALQRLERYANDGDEVTLRALLNEVLPEAQLDLTAAGQPLQRSDVVAS
jgi:FlaA1/EpsC-like NDP-sugar epimerase